MGGILTLDGDSASSGRIVPYFSELRGNIQAPPSSGMPFINYSAKTVRAERYFSALALLF
jgi:hypothetical protein